MRKSLLFLLLCINISMNAQTRKILAEINSIQSRELISFKYNAKNQLIYFLEKGPVTYREFNLKYDKSSDRLIEYTMNKDRGEMLIGSKFTYTNDGYVTEEEKSSGKQLRKMTEYNKIYIDNLGRLTKTVFEDGKLWEEFTYDENNNLTKYLVHSALGKNDIITEYKFDQDKSVFSNIENLPLWFWPLHMNNMKWCSDFTGSNNASENTTQDSRFGTDTIEITYEYDEDGYPVKQYYNNELAKEFRYTIIR